MCFQLTWQVLISESIIWQISNCLTDMKSESGIDTLVPAAIHPPPRCLDICHIPGGRLVGQSLIALTTGSPCQTPSPYRSSLPPCPPILPFTLQQPTATRPRCSWIIQAGRQPIALSFVGEDATTKDRQLAELLWLSSADQKTMVTSVSAERSRTLKLQAQSHIHHSGPISVLLRQIPELARFPSWLCLWPQMFGPQKRISLVKLFLSSAAKWQG